MEWKNQNMEKVYLVEFRWEKTEGKICAFNWGIESKGIYFP